MSYPAGSAEIEQLAGAICGNEQDAALLVQARIIAENELIWRAIRLHKLSLVERLLAEGRLNESEYFQQTRDRLLVATFEKFKEHLPPIATLRERLRSIGSMCPKQTGGLRHVEALFEKQTSE